MTEFKRVKEMIEKTGRKDIEILSCGNDKTIIVGYTVMDFENDKLTSIYTDVDRVLGDFTY